MGQAPRYSHRKHNLPELQKDQIMTVCLDWCAKAKATRRCIHGHPSASSYSKIYVGARWSHRMLCCAGVVVDERRSKEHVRHRPTLTPLLLQHSFSQTQNLSKGRGPSSKFLLSVLSVLTFNRTSVHWTVLCILVVMNFLPGCGNRETTNDGDREGRSKRHHAYAPRMRKIDKTLSPPWR